MQDSGGDIMHVLFSINFFYTDINILSGFDVYLISPFKWQRRDFLLPKLN